MKSQETNSRRRRVWQWPAVALLTALPLVAPTSSAHAAVRVEFPAAAPGVPAYARIGGEPIHTDEWAAIPFYRDPSCVPENFNLLRFLDAPRAFRCPLVVEGFEVWENGPGLDPAPVHAVTREADAVPVWFVSWPELQGAIADGVLTIGELSSLPSLVVGSAEQYGEVLHPGRLIHINARGALDDGRTFRLQFTCSCGERAHQPEPVVRIAID